MSEKRTVYAVTTGEYSDYRVDSLFEDRGDADATAKRIGGEVEEFDLYPPGSGDVVLPRWQVVARSYVTEAGVVQDPVIVESYGVDRDTVPPPALARKAVRERAAKVAAAAAENGYVQLDR